MSKRLCEPLIRDYLKLKSRLMRRLGSADLAIEILHETYLRLGVVDSAGVVRNPDAYRCGDTAFRGHCCSGGEGCFEGRPR